MRPAPCVAVTVPASWMLDLAPGLSDAAGSYRAATEVVKKIGAQWKELTDKEKKVRQFEPPCARAPRHITPTASSLAKDACGTSPLGPPPLQARPSRLCPTVSGCCAVQKYNEKAEKDKARYASEMKKCDLFRCSLPNACAILLRLSPMPASLPRQRLRLPHVVLPAEAAVLDSFHVWLREPFAAPVQPLIYVEA